MKFIKFILLAVGAFMVLLSMLWVVINLWWLILALVALFIAYGFMRENKKEEETKSDQPEEKSSTSNHPFEKD
jgi:membrane protein implicated in regulation of membrane protease activity